MPTARGSFEVQLSPQPMHSPELGRMTIDKTFRGDLEATSVGEMLSAMGTVKGSAGYVALERVTGALAGRQGSFVLQHNGTMTRGTPALTVQVVPDSGTGGLAGLAGSMEIVIEGKQHSYVFNYELS